MVGRGFEVFVYLWGREGGGESFREQKLETFYRFDLEIQTSPSPKLGALRSFVESSWDGFISDLIVRLIP